MSLSPKQLFINRAIRTLGHATLIESGADELFLMCLDDLEREIAKTRDTIRPPLPVHHYNDRGEGWGDDDL